jgi:hypothetical protein
MMKIVPLMTWLGLPCQANKSKSRFETIRRSYWMWKGLKPRHHWGTRVCWDEKALLDVERPEAKTSLGHKSVLGCVLNDPYVHDGYGSRNKEG